MSLDLPYFRSGARFRDELTAERLNKMVAAIRSMEIQPGGNVRVSRTPSGTILRADAAPSAGGAAAEVCPFRVGTAATAGGFLVTVQPGTLNGLLATNYAACLSAQTTPLSGTTASNCFVVLDVDTDGKQVTSFDLKASGSVPAAPTPTTPLAPTTFEYPLAVVVTSGAVYTLNPCSQLNAYVYESVRVAKTLQSAADNAFDIYYHWVVR